MTKTIQKQVQLMRIPAARRVGAIAAFLGLALTMIVGIFAVTDHTAHAAPASTLNYQARLKMSSGALPPDGYYNLQFNLYTAASSGTAVWTESYTAGSRIRVANGYVSVQLGSVSPFSSASPAIDWGEEMWLTMNVGGMDPTTPTWDGEMSPRLKLTAVPYAFKAEQAKTLQTTNGANTSTLGWETQTAGNAITLPDASGIVCLQANTSCGFAPTTGGTGYIQNGTVQQTATNFNIDGTGTAGTLNATTSLQLNGNDINTAGTLTNVAYLNQVTTFKATTDSTIAFRVQNAAGTSTVLNVDTSGGVVGVGGDLSVVGNAYVAGQVIAGSLVSDTVTTDAASFDSLGATNANVQSEAISGTLAVGTLISLAASDTSPGLLRLGVMNSASDPAGGSNGMMYYNSSMHEFRCYASGTWTSCGGANPVSPTGFVNGGNSFGETAVLGTTDSNDLNIVASGTALASFGADGDIDFTPTGSLNVQNSSGAGIMRVDTTDNTISLGDLDGTIGWTSMTALPTAMGMDSVSSFVYDGRLYMTGPTFGYRTIMGELNGADVTSWAAAAANFYAEAEWNGYVYDIDTIGGAVLYAKIQPDGTIGASLAAPTLPLTGSGQSEYNMLAHDGYLYVIKSDGIMVAKLGANGSVGAWQVVSGADAGGAPYDSRGARVVVAQNRLYTVGGGFSGGPESQTVAYATLNGDGTFGSWAYATDLPAEFVHGGLYTYGNALYAYANSGVVYRGVIGAGGNITAWQEAEFSVPGSAPYYNAAVELDVSTGYVYVAGRGETESTAAYSRQMGGTTAIDGSLTVSAGLAVTTGPTTLQGTANVAGATTLSNNLQVQNSSGENVLSVNAELGIVAIGLGGDFTGNLSADTPPANLPGSSALAVDWSGSGTYLAVGSYDSQYLTIYKRSGDTLTKLSTPSSAYPNQVRAVNWSDDDTYLAVGSNTSNANRLTIYKRSGDTLTALTAPGTMPGNGVITATWSPNTNYLAVGTVSAPYLTIYKRSGDTLTALTAPGTMPTGYGASVRWSPDSTYLTVGQYNGSQGIIGYKRSGDTFTYQSGFTTSSLNFAQEWSPDGNYFAVGSYDGSGQLEVWERTGDTFAGGLQAIDVQPGGTIVDVEWSVDGRYLMVSRDVSGAGTIAMYGFIDGQLTLLDDPASLPGNSVYDMDFSPDGEKLAVASFVNPGQFTVYDSSLGYDANGDLVVGSMITADALLLGTPAAASLASAKMVVTTTEIQTTLRLGNATSGISFNDITTGSGGNKLRYYGSARNLKTITLVPEYAGAVPDGTGTGTLSSAVDGDRPYYQWLSSELTNQSYAVTVTLALPSDWSDWEGTDDICVDSFTSDTTYGLAQLYVLNSNDGGADVNGPTITPSTASVWDTRCYSLTPADYSEDGMVTLRLVMTSRNGAAVRLGDITLSYLSKF